MVGGGVGCTSACTEGVATGEFPEVLPSQPMQITTTAALNAYVARTDFFRGMRGLAGGFSPNLTGGLVGRVRGSLEATGELTLGAAVEVSWAAGVAAVLAGEEGAVSAETIWIAVHRSPALGARHRRMVSPRGPLSDCSSGSLSPEGIRCCQASKSVIPSDQISVAAE